MNNKSHEDQPIEHLCIVAGLSGSGKKTLTGILTCKRKGLIPGVTELPDLSGFQSTKKPSITLNAVRSGATRVIVNYDLSQKFEPGIRNSPGRLSEKHSTVILLMRLARKVTILTIKPETRRETLILACRLSGRELRKTLGYLRKGNYSLAKRRLLKLFGKLVLHARTRSRHEIFESWFTVISNEAMCRRFLVRPTLRANQIAMDPGLQHPIVIPDHAKPRHA